MNQYSSRRFVTYSLLEVMPIQCDIHFTQIPRFKGQNVTYSEIYIYIYIYIYIHTYNLNMPLGNRQTLRGAWVPRRPDW